MIDPNGGTNPQVSGIDLIGNIIYADVTDAQSGIPQNNQYGVQIKGGDSELGEVN